MVSLAKLKNPKGMAYSLEGMKREPEPAEKRRDEALRAGLSAEALRIVEIFRNERAPVQALEAAIAANPVFTAHFLTLINFAAGLPQRVLSLSQAVSVLGLDQIKPLALGLLAFDLKLRPGADDEANLAWLIDRRDLWEHSLGTAAVASEIAVKIAAASPLHAFTAGFIHDIGRVLLFHYAPDGFIEAVVKAGENGIAIREAEKLVFGVDHVTVGTDWCQRSDLSMGLNDMLRLHHDPLAALDAAVPDRTRTMIAIVQAAEVASQRHDIGKDFDGRADANEAWAALGLREKDWHDRPAAIKREIEAAREMFGFPRENHRWVHQARKPKALPDRKIQFQEEKRATGGSRGHVIPFPIAPQAVSLPAEKPSVCKLVLLVVEDHGSLCDMVSLFMMRHGYHVRTANNGETALEILCREEIHLVLLDLMLPKLDGFEVLRQLHKAPRDRFPYVIVVSAGASAADRKKVLDLGANEYMPKPFHLNRLLERVQAVEKFLY